MGDLKGQEFSEAQELDEKTDIINHLEYCLNELSDEERKLINLHIVGFNNHEIGEKLQISEKTVRNKLSSSRKRIIKLWHQISLLIHFIWN
jgi:RNA polymerase sigma factor (sigma-70 family)